MSQSSQSTSTASTELGEGERWHPWSSTPIAVLNPSLRPPSPPPVKDVDLPPTSGWSRPNSPVADNPDERPRAPVDPVWSFDARDYPTGWLKADSVAASQAMTVAYDAALQWGERVRRLQMQWHRPHEYNLNMFGRGPRGDIAPDEVHAALDTLLASRSPLPPFTDAELDALHARMDIVWLRHSRAPPRLGLALQNLRIRGGRFTADELVRLSNVISFHCLVDFREVLICIDPRATVIYGRTRESEGVSRRWRSFGHDGVPRCWPRPRDPEWDDRSEISGSSNDEADSLGPPYSLSRSERAYQIYRHAGRDVERIMREVLKLEQEAIDIERWAVPVRAEVARRRQELHDLECERNELRLLQKGSIEGSF